MPLLSAFPARTHTLLIHFAHYLPTEDCALPSNPCNSHSLAMEADGQLLWDGRAVSSTEASALIVTNDNRWPPLNLDFSPSPDASYLATIETLLLIRDNLGDRSTFFICGSTEPKQADMPVVVSADDTECVAFAFGH